MFKLNKIIGNQNESAFTSPATKGWMIAGMSEYHSTNCKLQKIKFKLNGKLYSIITFSHPTLPSLGLAPQNPQNETINCYSTFRCILRLHIL